MPAQGPDSSAQSSTALQQKLAAVEADVTQLRRELAEARQREAEALEQQTATSQILAIISGAPTDPGPLLDAVAQTTTRLCDASATIIYRFDSDDLVVAAYYSAEAVPASRCTTHQTGQSDRLFRDMPRPTARAGPEPFRVGFWLRSTPCMFGTARSHSDHAGRDHLEVARIRVHRGSSASSH